MNEKLTLEEFYARFELPLEIQLTKNWLDMANEHPSIENEEFRKGLEKRLKYLNDEKLRLKHLTD
jgi:hypothetical protein